MRMNVQTSRQVDDLRGEVMRLPDEVAAMVRLKELGWGSKRIAAELGCSRNTVKRWLGLGGWRPCAAPSRSRKLQGLEEWLSERFRRHGGNADVVRQELAAEKVVAVSLRTVERAVAPLRRELVAQAQATVRFETRPGEQMQIDFGIRRVEIGGVATVVFLFVATLGFSRRLHVRAYGHEKQDSWFDGLESAFRAFGGVAEEVLLGEISDGATSDLQRATQIARKMVTDFGMSDLGRVSYQAEGRSPFLPGGGASADASWSQETAREIDLQVRRILEETLQKTREIVRRRRTALEAIADRLVERETIDAHELQLLLDEHPDSA